MKQKTIFIVAAALLLGLFLAGSLLYKNQKGEQAAQLAAQNQVALVRAHAPGFGNPNAPVHIVEFLDPACETCRNFYPLVKKLMADHPGQIRLSVRYAPFHAGSDQVVKLIEAARKQAQFRQTLETLFASQSSWVQNHTANVDRVWPLLQGAGLDMDRLQNDMHDPEIAQRIAQDLADAKTLKVTMTPEFFVNGRPLPNFGFDELKALVDEALVKANQRQGSP